MVTPQYCIAHPYCARFSLKLNLVPRAHVPFGQHQDEHLRVLVLTKRHVGSGNEIAQAKLDLAK